MYLLPRRREHPGRPAVAVVTLVLDGLPEQSADQIGDAGQDLGGLSGGVQEREWTLLCDADDMINGVL
ncbi:hypothetical protein MXD63_17665 [Frankia sp. Cpl3]|uniref:hypothetical protein n=1 Tax=Parafrankia colletiae TaxID=573497 RepID=UPI001041D421|nr:hypothetical protein [Parafrankia colletiae]MCK9901899.1 hypothetical protein [Frankia sp. Cpl3]